MISPAEALRATGGRWLRPPEAPEAPLRGAHFDTRRLAGEELFFALAGSGGDGHAHLHRLAGTAVRLAVVQREAPAPGYGGALLAVDDTRRALQAMAAFLVEKHAPTVVAVTGSYGKTTAKEAIAHVLAGGVTVLRTPGSYNNEIGVPLALLGLDGSQRAAVLEFSARHEGDIDLLGRIAPPHVAVLMGVGRAHIGVFGSAEAIYRAKGEVFTHLRPGGLAVVAAADPRLRALAAGHRTATFGRGAADFRCEALETGSDGRQCFLGVHGEARVPFRTAGPGAHGFLPLLAAWAVARELGLPDALAAERAATVPVLKHRSQGLRAPGGALVLDDTYNASPETIRGLVATLAGLPQPEKVLVLGHPHELEAGLAESARLVAEVLAPPLTACLVHDPDHPAWAAHLAAGARGVPVRAVPRLGDLIAELRALDAPQRAIALKAGRAAHLERAVAGLMGARVGCPLTECDLLQSCLDCPALPGS